MHRNRRIAICNITMLRLASTVIFKASWGGDHCLVLTNFHRIPFPLKYKLLSKEVMNNWPYVE